MAAKFSERLGITDSTRPIQVEKIDAALRNSLWNTLSEHFDRDPQQWALAIRLVARDHYKVDADSVPQVNFSNVRSWIKSKFFEGTWYETYDLLEFLIKISPKLRSIRQDALINELNYMLAREVSGYRFVSGILSPISNPTEADAISGVLQQSQQAGLFGVQQHIRTALALLSKKPDPDYRNSVKESISAVESAVKSISGESRGGLDAALDALSKKVQVHGGLKAAFKSLYGYSSDEDGVRHAILDEPNVGFDEAKYMLVSCSAFANFLMSKAEKAGLLPRQA
jgi:hypothetical protein